MSNEIEYYIDDGLPAASKPRYDKAYDAYKHWCALRKIDDFYAENVIFEYFQHMAQNKKSSTLWAMYSMLRKTLLVNDNVDISKFVGLLRYLKKINIGYVPTKSSIFRRQDIDTFLSAASIDFLLHKVALIIGISGGCRADELFKLKMSDVEFLEKKISIIIPDRKAKHSKAFFIINPQWIEIVEQYVSIRKSITNDRFFLQMKYGTVTQIPVGHNAFSKYPKKIAEFLKLENIETFTACSFRRTSQSLFANSQDAIQIKNYAPPWNFTDVVGTYVDNTHDALSNGDTLSSEELSNLHDQGEDDSFIDAEHIKEEMAVDDLTSCRENTSSPIELQSLKRKPHSTPTKLKRERREDVEEVSTNQPQSSNSNNTKLDDNFDHFGRYIASMLRTLSPDVSLRLQAEIVSVIVEASQVNR